MITKVGKYLIVGTKEDLDLFYERAQQEGIIEFISESTKRSVELPEEIQTLMRALKILEKKAPKKQLDKEGDVEELKLLAEKIVLAQADIDRLYEERRILHLEIARVSPFGDFLSEDLRWIDQEGKRKIQFFCAKTGKMISLKKELFYITTEYDLDYFISISPSTWTDPDLVEMRIERPLGELRSQKELVQESIERIEEEQRKHCEWMHSLRELLIEELNRYHLTSAKEQVQFPLGHASLFSVEAWISHSDIDRMFSLVAGLAVHCEPIQIEEKDHKPTVMENKGVNRLGEDLVKIYDAPSSSDKDPSGWVFWSFALFFAIIIADGGYGLLFLATALYLKWKVPTMQGALKRFYKMSLVISSFVIAWGVITSSFFGLEVTPDSFLSKLSPFHMLVEKKAQYHLNAKDAIYHKWLLDFPSLATATTGEEFLQVASKKTDLGDIKYVASDAFYDSILLEFSLVLGVLHIGCSLLRYVKRSLSNLGWLLFLVGGYLFFPSLLHAISMVQVLGIASSAMAAAIGQQLVYGGIGLALVIALIQRRWGGFTELMRVVEVFADVLSYLRLYALALAGAMMAATFNEMGRMIGLVGGFVVILAGHSINIVLSVMAGTIHGLRLNFIEWYHYSFEGGGRLFKPLQLLKSKED